MIARGAVEVLLDDYADDQVTSANQHGAISRLRADRREHLERANLFIISLDNRREWYRYHPLFAGLLVYRLQRGHPDWFI